jgi:glutaredoxin 3
MRGTSSPRVELYGADWCGYTHRAKHLLHAHGVPFVFHDLDSRPDLRERLYQLSGNTSVPQVLIDREPIGGFSELVGLQRNGALDCLASDPRESA